MTVIEDVENGETLVLTVNERPIADLVPHGSERTPWIPSLKLRRIIEESPADPGLMEDVDAIRGQPIEID